MHDPPDFAGRNLRDEPRLFAAVSTCAAVQLANSPPGARRRQPESGDGDRNLRWRNSFRRPRRRRKPTAVAVVSDILAIARAKQSRRQQQRRAARADAERTPAVTTDFTTKHYLRFLVKDRPGIIASLATILDKRGINIDSVLQKPGCPKSHLPFLITLEECKASLVDQALQQINALDFMVQPCLHMPIL